MLENLPYFCLKYYAKIANFIRLKKKIQNVKTEKIPICVFVFQ